MPTPAAETLPPSPTLLDSLIHRSTYTTCPPEEGRLARVHAELTPLQLSGRVITINSRPTAEQLDTSRGQHRIYMSGDSSFINSASSSSPSSNSSQHQDSDGESETSQETAQSPASLVIDDSKVVAAQEEEPRPMISPISTSPLPPFPQGPEGVASRPIPKYTSSFLRPGSKFTGTQQSDRQVYNVQVEIKHVDMSESFVCGYLRIEGLTPDHPTLTTYFEGEIIGTKYSFQTRRAEWGSNEKVDMQHWNRFPAWRPLAKDARKSGFSYKNFAERENVFMRWKEYFLVPDHRVRTISGASFEGFYYICFNQVSGVVSGIYFHAKSEKFQQLELKHVDDRGCMGATEFR